MVHLHLLIQFGNLSGNADIGVMEQIVRPPPNKGESIGLNWRTGGMSFVHQIDNNTIIEKYVLHGISIAGIIKHKPSVSKSGYGLDIATFCLTATVANVGNSIIFV